MQIIIAYTLHYRFVIRAMLLVCTVTLAACGGGSNNQDTNNQNEQLADPVTGDPLIPDPGPDVPLPQPQDPALTPSEPEPVQPNPVSTNPSIPPHLSDANRALRETLSEDIQTLLPEDCLLEVGGAVYCYSISTRTLMAVLQREAEIYWQFQLPGDESGNRIEALKILDTFSLAIIANTTIETGSPQYELSLFNLDGAFCCTFDIFEPLESLQGISDIPYPTINVDKRYILAASAADQFALAGTYSTLMENGTPGNLADWIVEGSLLTALRADNGMRKATRLFKDETILDIDYPSRTTLDVTTDKASYRLNAETLARMTSELLPVSGPAISDETFDSLLPNLYNHMQGNAIEILGEEVASITTHFNDGLDAELPPCARAEDTSDCFYEVETTPVTMECQQEGGIVTVSLSESREFIPGSGRNLQTTHVYDFGECELSSPQRNYYFASPVTLNGRVSISTFTGGVRQGNSTRKNYSFDGYQIRYRDSNQKERHESVTAELTLTDLATGQLEKRRELEASQYELVTVVYPRNQPTSQVVSLLSLSDISFTKGVILSDGINVTSVAASGSLEALGKNTGDKQVSMLIDPKLFRPYISNTTGLSGGVSLTASDGSSVNIIASSNTSGPFEELAMSFNDGTSYVRPFEALVRPWID